MSRAGRLLPWLPVAFGLGIVIYFTAEREPALWAALALAAVAGGRRDSGARAAGRVPAAARRSPRWRPGFAIVTLKSARIAHPILQHAAWNVAISGFVEVREERERTDRIVVRVHKIEGRLDATRPSACALSVKQGHGAAGRHASSR